MPVTVAMIFENRPASLRRTRDHSFDSPGTETRVSKCEIDFTQVTHLLLRQCVIPSLSAMKTAGTCSIEGTRSDDAAISAATIAIADLRQRQPGRHGLAS